MCEFNLGKRLADLREERDLKIREVAEGTGVSSAALNAYENNNKKPGFEAIQALAKFYEVPGDYILGLTSAKKRENIDLCEHLGLTEIAVENIREIARLINSYDSNSFDISLIFSNPEFQELITYTWLACSAAIEYKKSPPIRTGDEKVDFLRALNQFENSFKALYGKDGATITPSIRLDLLKMRIADSIRDLVEDVADKQIEEDKIRAYD